MITNANDGTEAAAAAADQPVEIIIEEEASTSNHNHKHLGNNGNKSTLLRVCISTGLLVAMVLLLVDVLGQPADSVMMTAGQLVSKASKAPAATAKTTKAPKTGGGGGCGGGCLWPLGTKFCYDNNDGKENFFVLNNCPTVEAEAEGTGIGVFEYNSAGSSGTLKITTFETCSSFTGGDVPGPGGLQGLFELLGTNDIKTSVGESEITFSATACSS